jgi:transcription initiation factor TFIID subunit 2
MIVEKKHKEKELAKLPSDEAKGSSIDLSSKKEEPEVDNVKQLKSVEPRGYDPVTGNVAIDTKPVPPKVHQVHRKFELK